MSPSTTQRANDKIIESLSLASAVRGLKSAVENMNYAINILESSVSAGSGDLDIPLLEDIIGLSGTKSPAPSVEGSPVVVSHPLSDTIIHIDTVTQVAVDDNGAMHVDNTPAGILARESKSDGPKWYMIAIGREPGVFFGSENIAANTAGIRNSHPMAFKTEALARARFDEELEAGRVEQVNIIVQNLTRDMIPAGTYIVPK